MDRSNGSLNVARLKPKSIVLKVSHLNSSTRAPGFPLKCHAHSFLEVDSLKYALEKD
jgi:hypothetical protein